MSDEGKVRVLLCGCGPVQERPWSGRPMVQQIAESREQVSSQWESKVNRLWKSWATFVRDTSMPRDSVPCAERGCLQTQPILRC